jgi:mannose-1-phosphate guanylyltransferase
MEGMCLLIPLRKLVKIGDGVRLQRCVLLEGARVKDHAWVKSTIIGWHSTVGRWARLENVSVLGDDVTIADEIYVNGLFFSFPMLT